MRPAKEVLDAIRDVIDAGNSNGYGPSTGFLAAREAVAEYVAHQGEVTANDVILCSGCSCSLDMSIAALAGPGQNILIPKPGKFIFNVDIVNYYYY